MKKLYGAVEIGGTKQQLAVVDEAGAIVAMICERIPLPNGAGDKISVKASGGVDTRETAFAMISAGAGRLGVSKVPQIVNDNATLFSASKGNQPPKFD